MNATLSLALQRILSRLAQSVERQTLTYKGFRACLGVHLNVVGSSPTLGDSFLAIFFTAFSIEGTRRTNSAFSFSCRQVDRLMLVAWAVDRATACTPSHWYCSAIKCRWLLDETGAMVGVEDGLRANHGCSCTGRLCIAVAWERIQWSERRQGIGRITHMKTSS